MRGLLHTYLCTFNSHEAQQLAYLPPSDVVIIFFCDEYLFILSSSMSSLHDELIAQLVCELLLLML